MLASAALWTPIGAIETVSRAFSIFFDSPDVFATIGFLSMLPYILCIGVLFSTLAASDPEAGPSPGAIVAVLLLFCVWFATLLAGTAAVIRATAEVYVGSKPAVMVCFQQGQRNVCNLACYGLMLMLPVGGLVLAGGAVMGILFGLYDITDSTGVHTFLTVLIFILVPIMLFIFVYVMISFQVTPQSIVLERNGPYDAIKRSWELIDGHRLYVFLAAFLMNLITQVIAFVPVVGFLWALFGVLPVAAM